MVNIRVIKHSGAKIRSAIKTVKVQSTSFMNEMSLIINWGSVWAFLSPHISPNKLQMLIEAPKMAVVSNRMHDISPSGWFHVEMFVFPHSERSKHLKLFPGSARLDTQAGKLLIENNLTSGFDLDLTVLIWLHIFFLIFFPAANIPSLNKLHFLRYHFLFNTFEVSLCSLSPWLQIVLMIIICATAAVKINWWHK